MFSTVPAKRAAQVEAHETWQRREWLGATRAGWPSAVSQAEDSMPASWLARLLDRWRERKGVDVGAANRDHLTRCRAIAAAQRAGVPADANDAQLCQEAAELARETARRLDQAERLADLGLSDRNPKHPAHIERVKLLAVYGEAVRWLSLRGLEDQLRRHAARSIRAALRRLRCERWWRRVLRGVQALAVETTARAIGLVNKRAGCYVSDESLKRRQGQRLRNERALESVAAVNEHGQEYTLAELAAKGPANRQIRRMELMTRIAGFELIAKECGHAAYFVTLTCPSSMHAYRTKPGVAWEVEPNPNYDGHTTVEDAHEYLCTQWRRFSEAARRAGLELYGFRIAEPNHDGTPHWHCLLFFPQRVGGGFAGSLDGRRPGYRVAVRLLRRYFLWAADGGERGARRHRVKVERIDWARGSAAGYVAKYVSKNIDGYRVEKDLYGNDTLTSSQRVDAWASIHRIRQFQQIGGAPVGVWRELRRLHPEQAEAAEVVAYALDAVNVTQGAREAAEAGHDLEAQVTAAHGWAAYLHVQGGHRVPRRALRLGVLREQTGELGRYGELVPPKPVGVRAIEVRELPRIGLVTGLRKRVTVDVESERASWLVVPKGNAALAAARLKDTQAPGRGHDSPGAGPMGVGGPAGAGPRLGFPPGGAAARPWSPVNNCTLDHPPALFGPSVERHKKRGRWHRWARKDGPGGQSNERKPHEEHLDRREGEQRRAGAPRAGWQRAGAR